MTALVVERDLREQAAQRFEQLGWPTTRHEEWRYTNLAPLSREQWKRAEPGATRAVDPELLAGWRLPGAAVELVFVDGVFVPELSTVERQLEMSEEVRARHFARYADYAEHAMTALNTANAQDGAMLHLRAPLGGWIHLLFIGTDGYESHPRNLIVADRGVEATIVESYVGTGHYFTNAVTEIVAGDGAVIDHTKLQSESREAFHIGTVQIHQERSSSVTAHSIALGGALSRLDTSAALTGEGASLVLDGLFAGTGSQHIDNHTVIDHVKPHCESLELYKGVLDGNARGIFDGRIIVRPDAVKTVSRQTNKNLLLSESAVVDSKPVLEIHNDDVKCNHGSTIGQLDEEALFYLRSRGIDGEEARGLLIHAFASEIVGRMKVDAVREQTGRALFRQMRDLLPERRRDPERQAATQAEESR